MNNKMKLNLLSFCTVLLWATAFPLTKVIGDQLSSYALGSIRCTTASITLIIANMITNKAHLAAIKKPACKMDFLCLFAAGTLGFALYLVFFNAGIQTLTSATSSIIISTTPVLTAIGASRIYKEKINIIGWVCILSAFCGVAVLLFWHGSLSINSGIIWTLAASLVFCIYNLLNRKLSSIGYSAVEIVTYGMISGTIALSVFIPCAVSEIINADALSLIIAIYLGIMPSAAAYILWAKAMELAEKTSEVTNYMFITPMLSALLGFAILGEIPNIGTILGGAIIISSVIIFSLKGK